MRISDWSSDVCSSDLRAFDRIMLRMERGEAQQGEAGERGDERPHQDADLRFLDEQRVAREGEPADEQAHREADPAQHRDAIDLEPGRSEEHTSELQSLMRISYAVFCLKKKTITDNNNNNISKLIEDANRH